MIRSKNVRTILTLIILACLETLGCVVYLLVLPRDPKYGVLLGYSTIRLVIIVGFLLALSGLILLIYRISIFPNKADVLLSNFFENKRHFWLFLLPNLILLAAGLLVFLSNPSYFPDLKHFYYLGYVDVPPIITWIKTEALLTRLQPVALWVTLVGIQTVIGMLYLNWKRIRVDIQTDLNGKNSKVIFTIVILASLSIVWVSLCKVLSFILVYKYNEASVFAQSNEILRLHNYAWFFAIAINILAAWMVFRWVKTRKNFSNWCIYSLPPLLALLISYALLTVFPTFSSLGVRYEDKWNVFYITQDSDGYVVPYSSTSSRPPIYPLFIQLVTDGKGSNHLLDRLPRREPIGDLTNPLIRVARAQTVFLLFGSIVACAALMLLFNSTLPALFFLWLYEYGFFCQESNIILTEAVTQAWLFLILAIFFLLLWKPNRFLLFFSGIFCAALYLTRPAGIYGVVILAASVLWAIRIDWRKYWLPSLLALLLTACLIALPSLYVFFTMGKLSPTAGYSRIRIGFALQVATPEDINLMPDRESKIFLSKALELLPIYRAKFFAKYPQETEHTFGMISENIYTIAGTVLKEVLPNGSSVDADGLLLKVSEPLLAKNKIDYYLIGWNSFWYITTRMSLDRLITPVYFWGIIVLCLFLAIYLRGWVGYSSGVLLLTHLAHMGVVSLFDIPIQRYLWATEFLVLLAIFILGWGVVTHAINLERIIGLGVNNQTHDKRISNQTLK